MRRISCFVLVLAVAVAVLPAAAQTLITNVPVQIGNYYLAANPATDMVYVVNLCGNDPNCASPGTVSVINGANNTVVATVTVQNYPEFLVVNSVSNKIYVTNRHSNTVSVIDGKTNTVTKTISVGNKPTVADVNPITNKIYVVNNGNGTGTTMSVIDGNTDTVTATVTVGNYPQAVSVNSVTNMVYVVNYCGNQPGCNATTAPSTVSVVNGVNNAVVKTVSTDYGAGVVLVNPVTNMIWVLNTCGTDTTCPLGQGDYSQVNATVTEINGSTYATQHVTVGKGTGAITVNNVTNQAYTSANTDNTSTIINGTTLATQTINVGSSPNDIEVNTSTDTVFVCNSGDNTVTAYNPATLSSTVVDVGNTPVEAWVNPVVNRIYVSNVGDDTVSVLGGVAPTALQFVPTEPCRVLDTRNGSPINGGTSQNFDLPALAEGADCPSLAGAVAYSLNVTVLPIKKLGYLTIWPSGEFQPNVSTMNSPDGRGKANAAIVPAGYQGGVSIFVTDTSNVILDVNGYFTAPASGTLQFYKLTPCRIVDTRGGKDQGSLQAGVERDYNIAGTCGIPSTALAYSFNITASPSNGKLDYLTVWPKGQKQPVVSTLNNPTGTLVANAAIVPAGSENATAFYAHSNQTDLLVDVDGYFAAPSSSGLSLYTQVPCRVLDTRQSGNGFNGQITVPVESSSCAPPNNAGGYIFNATVVPPAKLLYLTLWPHGTTEPVVSTLNANDGFVTSNMAIVPTNDGEIDAFSAAQTQLILDLFGYFAPQPAN